MDQFIKMRVSHGIKLEESDISALSEDMLRVQHDLEYHLFFERGRPAPVFIFPTLPMRRHDYVSRVQNRS